MNITVSFYQMGSSGLSPRTVEMSVVPDAWAAWIENELLRQYELVTSWHVLDAPAEFKTRIEEQGRVARARTVEIWNAAVLRVIPEVLTGLKAEAEHRGGNWGVKSIRNLELGLTRAEQLFGNSEVAWGIGRFSGSANSGISLATWQRVYTAVPREERLPLGVG